MHFDALPIAGAYRVRPAIHSDERGDFARLFCAGAFAAQGLETDFVQRSISTNRRAGTLRGLHFQASPHSETKLVRCLRGALVDVVADLRRGSPTFGQTCSLRLTADALEAVYIPTGCAHGFQTLSDDTHVFYDITPAYLAEAARGVRWNDPDLAIDWPLPDPILSDRDRALPRLSELADL